MVETAASRNSDSNEQTDSKKVPRKRSRWSRRFLVLLILIGTIGWFTPTIVAVTELRNVLPKLFMPSFPGSITFGDTSLSWISPINIKNFRLNDDEGRTVLEVGQLISTKPLWMLAIWQRQLGTVKVIEPVLHVSMTDQDSNLEQMLARLTADKQSQARKMPEVALEIEGARIELEHRESNRQSTIERVSVRAATKSNELDEINLLIGEVPDPASSDSSSNWIAIRFGSALNDNHSSSQIPNDQAPTGSQGSSKAVAIKQTVIRASHWNLERLKPLLSRFLPNNELAGELNADATVNLSQNEAGLDWDWNGSASLQKLQFATSAAIMRDRLQLDQISLTGRATKIGDRLALHEFKVTSDVGELSATGDCAIDAASQNSPLALIHTLLSDEDYHLQGHIDLKKLAGLLPQTLRVRDGIEITAGDVRAEFVGVDVQGVRRWSGTAEIAGLKANRQGQKISWDQPIASRMNAHRDRDALVIDLLECKSDFLQVAGKGTLEDARFTATGDLSKLARSVQQFVELGLDQMSGLMKASGEIKRADAGHVSLTSNMVLDDFAYNFPKGSAWREKHLEASIAAKGQTDARPMLTSIDAAEAHLRSGTDSCDVVLQQPVDLKSDSATCVANAQINGGLTSWQNRLRPFIALDQWRLIGAVNLAANLSADANQVSINQLKGGIRDLVAETPGWQVKDAEITLETSGKWTRQARNLTSPKLALRGKSLSLDLADVDCSFGQQGISKLVGSAAYQADLVQLSSWRNLAIPNPAYYLIGSLSGSAKISQQDRLMNGEATAQVEKLVVAGIGTGPNGQPQWLSLWKEPRLKLTAHGSYDQSGDLLNLDSGQFDLEGFSLTAQGKLTECLTNQRVELTGQLSYDWDTLVNRFGTQLEQQVQLSGKAQRPFSLKGSLASLGGKTTPAGAAQLVANANSTATGESDLSGDAGLGWTNGVIHGLKVGSGDLKVQLEQGVCRFAPIDLTINDGKLHTTPTLYLDRNPMLIVLPQERVIDHLSLSREFCLGWMRFVAPMLSETAQADGKISLDLQQATIPVGSLSNASVNGVMTIHGAQARPGPLAMQIVQAMNQLRSIITRQTPSSPGSEGVWLEMPEQQVPVKFERGWISHEGMTFIVEKVTVKTSGSVGIDSSLNIVAHIPIKDEWLGNQRVLKGRTIQIPISGTTSRPRIDPSFFTNFAKEIGGSLINDLVPGKLGGGVDNLINNGLNNLLKGKN